MFFYYWETDDELEEGYIKYGINTFFINEGVNLIEPDGFDFYFDGHTDNSIGLFKDDYGVGTGFLVEDNYVMSNAHVLEDNPQTFLAGMEDDIYAHKRSVEEVYLYKENYEPQTDIAIAELDDPIPEDVFIFDEDSEVGDNVLLQGYGIGTLFNQVGELYYQYRTEGYVDYFEEDLLSYTNPNGSDSESSTGGHSGSPVLNDDGEVVAVHGYSGLMGPDITKEVLDWVTDIT